MRKQLLLSIAVFISFVALCQTPAGSFQCNIKTAQTMTTAQISAYIAKGDYEGYRLKDQRSTLSFDNGFDIVLYSADEMQSTGLIRNAASYKVVMPSDFRMPVFHMTPTGNVGAGYTAFDKKYSVNKK